MDAAESALFAAIRDGKQWAIRWCLSNSREGAKRGYAARTELVAFSDQPVNVQVTINRVASRKPAPLDIVPFNRTPEYREMIRQIKH